MKKSILFHLLLIVSNLSYSQVLDADRVDNIDSTEKRLNLVVGLNGSADKQKKNLVDASTVVDISYQLKRNYLSIFKGNFDFTTNGNEFLQNSGYFHFRLRDNDSRLLSPEFFMQFQWNGALGMVGRKLLGANYRWMVLDNTIKNDLFFGLGLMYEEENWNYKGVKNIQDLSLYSDTLTKKIRINQYTKCAFNIKKDIDLVLSNFIQFNIKDLANPRISSNAGLSFKISRHFEFALNYESMYDFSPVVPIDKYIYSIKGQLNIKI